MAIVQNLEEDMAMYVQSAWMYTYWLAWICVLIAISIRKNLTFRNDLGAAIVQNLKEEMAMYVKSVRIYTYLSSMNMCIGCY